MGSSLPTFGFLTKLVDIHFGNPALPWYWWYPLQPVYYFVYLAPPFGSHWMRLQIEPIIRILPIDTQVEVPTTPIGEKTLIAAIQNGVPDAEFGRFNFTDPFFWKVMGLPPPTDAGGHIVVPSSGKITAAQIAQINAAAAKFESNWNKTAFNLNSLFQSTNLLEGTLSAGAVIQQIITGSSFALPPPDATNVSFLAKNTGNNYLGPTPGGFNFGSSFSAYPAISRQATAAVINVGQLDPKTWDMSVFPPVQRPPGRAFSAGGYGGYGTSTFPLQGPDLQG